MEEPLRSYFVPNKLTSDSDSSTVEEEIEGFLYLAGKGF